MPLSEPANISVILQEIILRRPKSILDLGVGMGLIGAAARQYLDIQQGRIEKNTWKTILCGVEGFEGYRNPMWEMYTFVETRDFSTPEEVIRYKDFDLVLMIDSLEHLDSVTGHWMLDTLIDQNKHLIVSVPTGTGYLEQGAVNGNELERHRTKWEPEEFTVRGGRIIHQSICTVSSIPGRI